MEVEDEDVVVVVVAVPVEGLIILLLSGTVRRCTDGTGAALEGREGGGARGVFGGPSVRLGTLRGTAVVVVIILISVELYSLCSLIKSNNLNTRNETLGSLKSISEALLTLLVFEPMFTTSSTVLATF
jgi:hypothetical protein